MTPAPRKPTDHVYYSMTKGLCGTCKGSLDAKIVFRDDRVYLDKFCPSHGHQTCLVSSSVEWYLDALSFIAPSTPPAQVRKDVTRGCPFDCGPCASHQQKVYLPVIPITSACNLDCPICYTVNKNDGAHRLTLDGMRKILDHLLADHTELDIINFTGGEPTLHPELPEILAMCRDAGIRRLTISTNGLKLLDEAYVEKLAAVDARIVLSLDTFRPETDHAMLGADTVRAKLRALDLLEKHDVATTILPAVAAGLNDDEIRPLLDLVLTRPMMRSLELHTLTFTGQGASGSRAARGSRSRISTGASRRRPAGASAGAISCRRRSLTRTATPSATCSASTAAGTFPSRASRAARSSSSSSRTRSTSSRASASRRCSAR
ncbi:MAG: radical SAM protein [Acidobacteriota bacterium]